MYDWRDIIYDDGSHLEEDDIKFENRRNKMSQTTQEVLTVESVNQYGFRAGGKNYSISTLLAKKGVTPQSFQVGSQIQAEIWTGPQGGKKVNSFQFVGAVSNTPVNTVPQMTSMPLMPQMPSLPVTTISSTPAPGGAAVVNKSYSNGKAPTTQEEKMTREDWKNKDLAIELVAVIKSSIESPALGEHVTGKSTAEFMQLTRDFVKYNLETLRLAKEGQL